MAVTDVPVDERPSAGESRLQLRVCALYPDLMNIYADRGNLMVLERRCAWRGIGFELSASGLGDTLDPDAHDLYYIGGGQDRDQQLCAQDLTDTKKEGLFDAARRGAVVLGVCGGYQLLGRSYTLGRDEIPGVGLLDAYTVRAEGPRLTGNVAVEISLDEKSSSKGTTGTSSAEHPQASKPSARQPADNRRILAGFENHGGRTHLGEGQEPLGRVLKGHGNDGHSGFEGARTGNVIGTYLHGPLLPKNVWFADWLIARALSLGTTELTPLHDSIERETHVSALKAAGVAPSL
jgi:lipid II isoglutaminyl synthase (glutamine-hydrolysing)